MSNLSDTAETTRKLVVVGAIMFVSIIVGWALYQQARGFLAQRAQNKPPEPTLGFGALPPIAFPPSDNDLSVQLETVGNVIPSWGPLANVYLVTFPTSTFLDLDQARAKAAALGFPFEPSQITDKVFRWSKSDPLQSILDLNIITDEFTLDVAWETDPSFLNNKATPTQEQALSEANAFFKRGGFLSPDLQGGRSEVTYLKYTSGKFAEVVAFEADFAQVDLFRKSIKAPRRLASTPTNNSNETARIMTPDPKKGTARVLISSARETGKRIVSAEYSYNTVDYEQFHTYPIITGPQAFQMLQNSQAYIASPPESGSTAVVRDISFGYYDPMDNQKFLQPIYIFEGDNGFIAYVPAIVGQYLAQ